MKEIDKAISRIQDPKIRGELASIIEKDNLIVEQIMDKRSIYKLRNWTSIFGVQRPTCSVH